jgi:hypothetical protein
VVEHADEVEREHGHDSGEPHPARAATHCEPPPSTGSSPGHRPASGSPPPSPSSAPCCPPGCSPARQRLPHERDALIGGAAPRHRAGRRRTSRTRPPQRLRSD